MWASGFLVNLESSQILSSSLFAQAMRELCIMNALYCQTFQHRDMRIQNTALEYKVRRIYVTNNDTPRVVQESTEISLFEFSFS